MMQFSDYLDLAREDNQTSLVRDRTLDGWGIAEGYEHQIRKIRGAQEFGELLRRKIIEQAFEIVHAGYEELPGKLADTLAVLQGIAHRNSIDWDMVIKIAQRKETETGAFERGAVWDRTIEDNME